VPLLFGLPIALLFKLDSLVAVSIASFQRFLGQVLYMACIQGLFDWGAALTIGVATFFVTTPLFGSTAFIFLLL
jgi:hypothetical protein